MRASIRRSQAFELVVDSFGLSQAPPVQPEPSRHTDPMHFSTWRLGTGKRAVTPVPIDRRRPGFAPRPLPTKGTRGGP
jgi:hypothetical protein